MDENPLIFLTATGDERRVGMEQFMSHTGEEYPLYIQTKAMEQILVVDDEPDFRTLIMKSLESAGFGSRAAASAEEALELLETFRPDVIVSDINMDGMSGYELLETVRRDSSTAGIPFIFMTGVGGKERYRHGMELGADDFIEKPFSTAELIAAVKTRLRLRNVQREAGEQRIAELRSSVSAAFPQELRTPLNIVLAFSQILRDDASVSSEEVRKFAAMIHKAGERLHHQAESYLVYAQLEVAASDATHLSQLRAERTDHAEKVIHTVAHDVAQAAGRSGDVVWNLEPAACAITYEHLAKIVRELMDNALKFSDPGRTIEVRSSRDGDHYLVTVSDKGPGMTRDQIQNIEVFRQFDRKKGEQQGAGLGLGLVKRIMEIYDGNCSVESMVGGGTTVTVTMKLVK